MNDIMIRFLNKLQKILRLQDWDITLLLEPGLDTEGCTKTIYNDCQAIIRLKAELSEENLKFTLIHELLHIVFRDSHDLASEHIRNEAVGGLYVRYNERAIEQTAKAIFTLIEGYRPNNQRQEDEHGEKER